MTSWLLPETRRVKHKLQTDLVALGDTPTPAEDDMLCSRLTWSPWETLRLRQRMTSSVPEVTNSRLTWSPWKTLRLRQRMTCSVPEVKNSRLTWSPWETLRLLQRMTSSLFLASAGVSSRKMAEYCSGSRNSGVSSGSVVARSRRKSRGR